MNTKGIDGNLKTESLQRAVEFVPKIIRCTENRKPFDMQVYILFLTAKALNTFDQLINFFTNYVTFKDHYTHNSNLACHS